jgi:hypothetical protein
LRGGDAAGPGGNVAAAQRPSNLGKDLLVSLCQQLPLVAAALASPHDRPACHRNGSIIHGRDLLSWLPIEDVFQTPPRSRLNVRRQTQAAATPAEGMTQLQAILQHCTARAEVTPASVTQRWSIQWVSNDKVLLKSSDVGDYYIRRQPNGSWQGD